jgi:hypothetical protein
MKQLRIRVLVATALAGAVAAATIGTVLAQTQPGYGPGGMMGGGQAYGPGGMMGGQGFGPGMVGGGYGYGPGGMMRGWGTTTAQAQPLTSLDDARQAFQRSIDATGISNLALDEVMQFQWNYYAIVKDTSTGNGAFELLANPQTGAVLPEMGPNMMWNTEYGHMAGGHGMMGGWWQQPTGLPTVSADQAQQNAQQWLDSNQPGSGTETPDALPGYYTLHISRDGQLTGMLSVNAYTGAVWYHTWHGVFIASSEA